MSQRRARRASGGFILLLADREGRAPLRTPAHHCTPLCAGDLRVLLPECVSACKATRRAELTR